MSPPAERDSSSLLAALAEHAPRITRFGTVGAVCALLNVALLWLMTDKLGLHYLISTAVAFLLTNLLGFLLNRWYSFRSTSKAVAKEAGRYYIAMAGSFTAAVGMMYVLVDLLRIHYLVSSIVVSALFFLWNYAVHLSWTFRHRGSAAIDGKTAASQTGKHSIENCRADQLAMAALSSLNVVLVTHFFPTH